MRRAAGVCGVATGTGAGGRMTAADVAATGGAAATGAAGAVVFATRLVMASAGFGSTALCSTDLDSDALGSAMRCSAAAGSTLRDTASTGRGRGSGLASGCAGEAAPNIGEG